MPRAGTCRPSLRTVEERNELVQDNFALYYWVAGRFLRSNSDVASLFTLDELASEASLALIRAAELHDEPGLLPRPFCILPPVPPRVTIR